MSDVDIDPDVLQQLLCPIDDLLDTLQPSVLRQLLCPIDDLADTLPPDVVKILNRPWDEQIGGNIGQHIRIRRVHRRDARHFKCNKTRYSIEFVNTEHLDMHVFLNEVSLIIFYCYRLVKKRLVK